MFQYLGRLGHLAPLHAMVDHLHLLEGTVDLHLQIPTLTVLVLLLNEMFPWMEVVEDMQKGMANQGTIGAGESIQRRQSWLLQEYSVKELRIYSPL